MLRAQPLRAARAAEERRNVSNEKEMRGCGLPPPHRATTIVARIRRLGVLRRAGAGSGKRLETRQSAPALAQAP